MRRRLGRDRAAGKAPIIKLSASRKRKTIFHLPQASAAEAAPSRDPPRPDPTPRLGCSRRRSLRSCARCTPWCMHAAAWFCPPSSTARRLRFMRPCPHPAALLPITSRLVATYASDVKCRLYLGDAFTLDRCVCVCFWICACIGACMYIQIYR